MHLLGLNIHVPAPRWYREQFQFTSNANRRLLMVVCMLVLVALTGCNSGDLKRAEEAGEVIVFAAASLTESFGEIARQFEIANPGVKVVLNLAGSQQLVHQLSQGAPADVFASADEEQMAAAIEVDRVKPGNQQPFAGNELALIFPASNPAGLRTLSDLARPGLQLVLAAPEVPAGHYAELFLDTVAADPGFGPIFRESVLANVVSYEENVRAVLSKVQLGEADGGIVYKSDVVPGSNREVSQLQIPTHLNIQASYVIAPLVDSENSRLARKFVAYVLSAEGQEVLVDNGLQPITAEQ